jgi:hypothetical protein
MAPIITPHASADYYLVPEYHVSLQQPKPEGCLSMPRHIVSIYGIAMDGGHFQLEVHVELAISQYSAVHQLHNRRCIL